MKLLSYKIAENQTHQIGVLQDEIIYNLNVFFGDISLIELIQIEGYQSQIKSFINSQDIIKHELKDIMFLPPIPKPNSFRDAYAFKEHVETCRANRGVDMIPEFNKFPVFYFSNHNAMYANEENIELMPDHFNKLDYELEFAIIIGKKGKNIVVEKADDYIAGFCILNDLSARTLQINEMKLNLGPAKGKDFANIIGPYLVTKDELESKAITTTYGKKYDLEMKCFVNGELLSKGNAKEMYWTFAQIIERASYGVELLPGDIIGSGTVGTGCLFELNGSRKKEDPEYIEKWINPNDKIEMEIEGLGKITNKILQSNTSHSIIKNQK